MFAWIFHRVSGVFLIFLLGTKVFTGFYLLTKDKKPDWAILLHRQPTIDMLLLILLAFHALYGAKTILYDLGLRKDRLLFWASTILAGLVSIFLIGIYLRIT